MLRKPAAYETVAMLLAVVRHLSRCMPRTEAPDAPDDEWGDSDASCHNSSYELSSGLDVIEHFEHFADTMPAFHLRPGAAQTRP